MNHIHRSTATLLVALSVLLATPNARAQTVIDPQQAQGLFSTWSAGLTVRGSTDQVLIRAPGYANGVPSRWTSTLFSPATADHPDYSIDALTHSWPAPTAPVFGDISTGNDLMPWVDSTGQLDMNNNDHSHWYALTVAVDANAVGMPNTMIPLRAAAHGNALGDILSYYAIGSTEINPRLVNTVRLESSREQLQLSSISSSNMEIGNLDYHLGVISTDPTNQSGVMIPARHSFYFTLTKAWVTSPAIVNSGMKIGGAAPNASTVYVMTWSMTPTPGWTPPTIAFSHAELFGTIQIGDVEIDALSVDEGTIGPYARSVVFSLTPASDTASGTLLTGPVNGPISGPFDQILVYQRDPASGTTQTSTRPLMTDPHFGTSTSISSRLGLVSRDFGHSIVPDNVTSTCGIDPRDGHAVKPVVGLATDEFAQGAGLLGLSVIRTCPAHPAGSSLNDTLTFQVTGLSYTGYQYGAVQMYIEGAVYDPSTQTPTGSSPVGYPIFIDDVALDQNRIDVTVPMGHAWTDPPASLRVSAELFGYDPDQGGWVPVRQSWVTTIGI